MFATIDHREPSELQVGASQDEAGSTWTLLSGTIVDISSSVEFVADIGGRRNGARRAASCLLEPAPGDHALIALAGPEAYVVAILHRPGSLAATLSADVPANRLVIRGANVSIAADSEVTLEAPAVTARARRFTVFADAMGLVGKMLTQALKRWQVSAVTMEVVANDIATKAARRVAIVDETDVLQAGSLVQTIETAIVTTTNAAVIAAKEDLRLDGERVTVG